RAGALIGIVVLGFMSPVAGCSSSHDGGGMPDAEEPPSSTPIPAVNGDAVYIVNGGDPSISVGHPAKADLLGTIRLNHALYPHHIYLSHDRSRLAVAVPGMDMSEGHPADTDGFRGAVMVLDARTGATLASVVLDHVNHNVIFSVDDAE